MLTAFLTFIGTAAGKIIITATTGLLVAIIGAQATASLASAGTLTFPVNVTRRSVNFRPPAGSVRTAATHISGNVNTQYSISRSIGSGVVVRVGGIWRGRSGNVHLGNQITPTTTWSALFDRHSNINAVSSLDVIWFR
ncbi:MAG: hypothetical protein FWG67_03940 [Defluviitaleaceae bacterium]|nr:hypothetical protein [Defluviitaleaceae bacterium]